MILDISIKNSFAHKDTYIVFSKGLNVITGKNGTGKTELIELINYAFFGNKALRDLSTNYKSLSVVLHFVINNNIYRVTRNTSVILESTIDFKSYTKICTGTTAVNKKIEELLTYNKDVYYLTNFCKQHDLLSFTSLKEKSLLNLIELVTGLKDSYALIDYFKTLKQKYTAEKKTYETLLSEHVLPDFTENELYESYDEDTLQELKNISLNAYKEFNDFKEIYFKYDFYHKSLKDVKKMIVTELSYDTVCDLIAKHLDLRQQHKDLTTKLSYFDTCFKDTSYTLEDLNVFKQANSDYDEYIAHQKCIKNSVVCPKCSNTFIPNSSLEISSVNVVEKPHLTRLQLDQLEHWLTTGSYEYEAVNAQIKDIETSIWYLGDFDFLSTIKLSLEYNMKVTEENKKFLDNIDHLCAITNCYTVEQYLDRLNTLENEYIQSSKLYDNLLTYLSTKSTYIYSKNLKDKLISDISKHNLEIQFLNICMAAAEDTKKQVQLSAIPLLNHTSSEYLNYMTGGERLSLEITPDFKIFVDNLNIDLVEGSAQVLSNIALRLSILKLYYKDNFCVFLGDELDESLHEDRFNMLNNCFNSIVDYGYQLIIISHKAYENANIIQLGSNS